MSYVQDTTRNFKKMKSLNLLPPDLICVSHDLTSLYTDTSMKMVLDHVGKSGTVEAPYTQLNV